jgi:hypothetical protein
MDALLRHRLHRLLSEEDQTDAARADHTAQHTAAAKAWIRTTARPALEELATWIPPGAADRSVVITPLASPQVMAGPESATPSLMADDPRDAGWVQLQVNRGADPEFVYKLSLIATDRAILLLKEISDPQQLDARGELVMSHFTFAEATADPTQFTRHQVIEDFIDTYEQRLKHLRD